MPSVHRRWFNGCRAVRGGTLGAGLRRPRVVRPRARPGTARATPPAQWLGCSHRQARSARRPKAGKLTTLRGVMRRLPGAHWPGPAQQRAFGCGHGLVDLSSVQWPGCGRRLRIGGSEVLCAKPAQSERAFPLVRRFPAQVPRCSLKQGDRQPAVRASLHVCTGG